MITCETCQSQLLHHMYGLLDDLELQALHHHLSGCAACRAARDKARLHQQILAAAAKGEFPSVHFAPLQEASTIKAPPVVVPLSGSPARLGPSGPRPPAFCFC